jgi:hypothetical protein
MTIMDKRKILIQLDTDPLPSVFDRVVAVDAGADEIFSYGGIKPELVRELVHGAIFTRGPKDLAHTAFFVGGNNVAQAEAILEEIRRHLLPQFGLQVSALLDSNGCNTTAAAAVWSAGKHGKPADSTVLVLAATGPVGQRVARLLARLGATVRVGSRQMSRSEAVCRLIRERYADARIEPVVAGTPDEVQAALTGCQVVISAGAAGVMLLPRGVRTASTSLEVAIDLNAVPPAGIEGVEPTDKAADRDGVVCYGAIGVGGLKMKLHKAAIARLFQSNDQVLDAEEVYDLAPTLS